MGFREYQTRLLPPPLRGPNGEAWARGFGSLKDALVARAKAAVRARCASRAPDDALPLVGLMFGLERALGRADGTDETVTQFVARLRAARDAWAKAGTKNGLVEAFAVYGYTNARVYERWDLAAAGIEPPVEGQSRRAFYIVVAKPHQWSEDAWDDGRVYDAPGETWGSNATIPQVARLHRIIAAWKSAHTVCAGLVVAFGGSTELTAYDPSTRAFQVADAAGTILFAGRA